MLLRVLRSVSVVVFLAGAVACGGVAPEEADPVEQSAAPATEAVSDDRAAMGPIGGCGAFQQRCCEGNACVFGLECDPSTNKCLH